MDSAEQLLAEQIAAKLPDLAPKAQVSVTFAPGHPVQGPGLIVTVDGKQIVALTWAEVADLLLTFETLHECMKVLSEHIKEQSTHIERQSDVMKALKKPLATLENALLRSIGDEYASGKLACVFAEDEILVYFGDRLSWHLPWSSVAHMLLHGRTTEVG
jgi:hypothetical protein